MKCDCLRKSHTWRQPLALVAAVMTLAGCIPGGKPTIPMAAETVRMGVDPAATVVFLPGIRNEPSDFVKRGFHEPLPKSFTVIAADAHFGYYRSRTLATRLAEDILPQPRAAHSVTLAGVSLGGLGSLLYYCDTRDPAIERIVLLAPFLGDDNIIEHVRSASSLQTWTADDAIGREFERKLWSCLRDVRWNQPDTPEVWLAYGTEDDLALAHGLLAGLLPERQVITTRGGHRWSVWRALWGEIATRIEWDQSPDKGNGLELEEDRGR